MEEVAITKNEDNEELDLEDNGSLNPENIGSAEDVYPDANIKIDREQYSIFELKRRYDKKGIILDPEFQRNDVWKIKQKSELIESVLMGIPLPLIYLVERKDGKLAVVDGRQRLTTFFKFLDGGFKLSGLRILREINGRKFKELDDKFQSDLEDFQVIVQIIKPPTPDRIKFDIFDRVNRGGTSLNNQEMRNALYLGRSTRLLSRLSERMEFLKATGYSVKSTRMKAEYIILRFIAFYLWKKGTLLDKENNRIEYRSDLEDFLGSTMEYLNRISDDEENKLEELFAFSMRNAVSVLGENAFRIPSYGGKRRPVSMTLFECLSYFFTIQDWYPYRKDVKKNLTDLFNMDNFYDSLTSNVDSKTVVDARFNFMEVLAKEARNDYEARNQRT